MVDFGDISNELSILGRYRSARELSTFKGGGFAYTFLPTTIKEAVLLVAYLTKHNMQYAILGGGSNMLIADGICKTALVDFGRLTSVKVCGNFITALAGTPMSKIISEGRKHNLGGLEFLSGVPCTLGGAIKMNAGAFSSQIVDYLYTIDTLTVDIANCDKICNIRSNDDCKHFISSTHIDKTCFSYRHGWDEIVLEATLKLDKINKEESIKKSQKYLAIRKQTQPHQPSLGCTFKNGKIPSGKLIEECSLKGYKIGGAMISDKHANFIVNLGGATASDYLALKELAKERVYQNFSILLQEEFCLIE